MTDEELHAIEKQHHIKWVHWVEADLSEYLKLINAKTYPNISSILRKIDKELKEEANEQQIPLG